MIHLAKDRDRQAQRLPDVILGAICAELLHLVRPLSRPAILLISTLHVAFHEVSSCRINAIIALLGEAFETIVIFEGGSLVRRIFVMGCEWGKNLLALAVCHMPGITVRVLSDANRGCLTWVWRSVGPRVLVDVLEIPDFLLIGRRNVWRLMIVIKVCNGPVTLAVWIWVFLTLATAALNLLLLAINVCTWCDRSSYHGLLGCFFHALLSLWAILLHYKGCRSVPGRQQAIRTCSIVRPLALRIRTLQTASALMRYGHCHSCDLFVKNWASCFFCRIFCRFTEGHLFVFSAVMIVAEFLVPRGRMLDCRCDLGRCLTPVRLFFGCAVINALGWGLELLDRLKSQWLLLNWFQLGLVLNWPLLPGLETQIGLGSRHGALNIEKGKSVHIIAHFWTVLGMRLFEFVHDIFLARV